MSIPIRGRARGNAQLAYAIARQRNPALPAFTLDYFTALYSVCAVLGINADILVAQWDLETDRGRDTDWTQDKNPAGIAIFPDGSSWGLVFTPITAAQAQGAHMGRYLGMDNVPAAWIALDARWNVPEMLPMVGSVTYVEDLGNGRWATDKQYASKLIGRYEAYWGPYVPVSEGGDAVVVTKPKIIDKWLHVAQDGYPAVIRYIANRNGQKIRVIFVHVQEGQNYGSWQHFHAVSASATVLVGKNGDVWRLVPEEHGPWTNGDVNKPDAFATAMMNRWGWDPNVYCLTIESEGFSGGLPYTDAQRNAIYWQVNDWCSRYAIDAIYILGHYQVNSVSRPNCPEPAVNGRRVFLEAIRAQASGVPVVEVPTTVYRDPWPVKTDAGVLWDGLKDVTVTTGPSPVTFYADKGTKKVNVDLLNGRQWASTTSTLTNNAKSSGQTIDALGWVEGEEVDGERRWWVAKDGTRYWSGGTAETPTKQAPVPTTPDDPASSPDYGNIIAKIPVVLNGNVYYPFEDRQGDAGVGRQLVAVADGQTYTWADSKSTPKGAITTGTKRFAAYWVRGEKIGNEDLWYVLDDGSGNPVKTGPRIWAGLMAERPD